MNLLGMLNPSTIMSMLGSGVRKNCKLLSIWGTENGHIIHILLGDGLKIRNTVYSVTIPLAVTQSLQSALNSGAKLSNEDMVAFIKDECWEGESLQTGSFIISSSSYSVTDIETFSSGNEIREVSSELRSLFEAHCGNVILASILSQFEIISK